MKSIAMASNFHLMSSCWFLFLKTTQRVVRSLILERSEFELCISRVGSEIVFPACVSTFILVFTDAK